ncbi:uncharacterized protein [Pleurodeles waltl]|uniref:uncharacterized protein n=1 Tax=Pleurodeles waltl TaxID=8319 RepID=UPI0037099C98
MGKRKADDVSVPQSRVKKPKKRSVGKVEGCPNTNLQQFKTIDSLFEEVEAILRSPSVTGLSTPDTIPPKKIPDLFNKKKTQMHRIEVKADLHPPPHPQGVIPSLLEISPSLVETNGCLSVEGAPHLRCTSPPPTVIPCSNRFSVLSSDSVSPGHSQTLLVEGTDKDSLDGKMGNNEASQLTIISQKIDDVKCLLVSLMNKIAGLYDQKSCCNCIVPHVSAPSSDLLMETKKPSPPTVGDKLTSSSIHNIARGRNGSSTTHSKSACQTMFSTHERVPKLSINKCGSISGRGDKGTPCPITSQLNLGGLPPAASCCVISHSATHPDHLSLLQTCDIKGRLRRRREDATIYLTRVPKLPQGNRESSDSLTNKVIYWIRSQRNCLSVIPSDICEAHRHNQLGSDFDYISILFNDSSLVNDLLAFDTRTGTLCRDREPKLRLSSQPPGAPLCRGCCTSGTIVAGVIPSSDNSATSNSENPYPLLSETD